MERRLEKGIALASFVAAVVLAFVAVIISEDHDIEAGVCMVIAQFLLLTASILGIDYHFDSILRKDTHVKVS